MRTELGRGSAYISMVETVYVVTGVVAASAVDGKRRACSAGSIGDHAGDQERECGEVATIQGNILDFLLDDHVSFNGSVLAVQRRDLCGHVDRLAHGADIEPHIASQLLTDLERNAGLVESAEALFLGDQLIRARRE